MANWIKNNLHFAQYAGLLFVMFAAQLAGGIITFVYKDAFQTGVHDSMVKLMGIYNTDENANTAWNKIQSDVSSFPS